MEKRLENKLTMYEGVVSLLKDNQDMVNIVPGFTEAAAGLSSALADIKTKSIEADKASTGKTAAKQGAREELTTELLPVCSALYIFGRKQKKTEISERADISESGLRKMRDTELGLFGKDIAELAGTVAADLAFAGITGEKIESLSAKAAVYADSIGARESGVAKRIGSREEMKDLFRRADELLNHEIDRYMEILRPSHGEFYMKYSSARSIKDIGVRHKKEEAAAAVS
ncbi:MAG: hypothetical protein JXN64_07830 [Spirochaetes bacterium]|nr:hypothetical protein [Spirochaetota bacterium]